MSAFDDQWYVACASDEVTAGKKLRVSLHGQVLTMWRLQDGSLAAIDDRCPHMSASLSLGRVVDGHVECAYHGLLFDRSGRCVHLPRHDPEYQIPRQLQSQSYRVRELDGWVFVFWGEADGELPDIPYYDVLRDNDVDVRTSTIVVDLPVHITRAMENSIDLMHLGAVHRGWIDKVIPSVLDVRASVDGHHLYTWQGPSDSLPETNYAHVVYPSLWMQMTTEKMFTVVAVVPLDADRSRIYVRSSQGYVTTALLGDALIRLKSLVDRFALWQDTRVMVSQSPNSSVGVDNETLVKGDLAIALYRRMYRSFSQGPECSVEIAGRTDLAEEGDETKLDSRDARG